MAVAELWQESITRSKQLPRTRVKAFSTTSLSLEVFYGANLEYLLSPTNQSAKPKSLKWYF